MDIIFQLGSFVGYAIMGFCIGYFIIGPMCNWWSRRHKGD